MAVHSVNVQLFINSQPLRERGLHNSQPLCERALHKFTASPGKENRTNNVSVGLVPAEWRNEQLPIGLAAQTAPNDSRFAEGETGIIGAVLLVLVLVAVSCVPAGTSPPENDAAVYSALERSGIPEQKNTLLGNSKNSQPLHEPALHKFTASTSTRGRFFHSLNAKLRQCHPAAKGEPGVEQVDLVKAH